MTLPKSNPTWKHNTVRKPRIQRHSSSQGLPPSLPICICHKHALWPQIGRWYTSPPTPCSLQDTQEWHNGVLKPPMQLGKHSFRGGKTTSHILQVFSPKPWNNSSICYVFLDPDWLLKSSTLRDDSTNTSGANKHSCKHILTISRSPNILLDGIWDKKILYFYSNERWKIFSLVFKSSVCDTFKIRRPLTLEIKTLVKNCVSKGMDCMQW